MFSDTLHTDMVSGFDARTRVLSGTQSECTSYHKYHIYMKRQKLTSQLFKRQLLKHQTWTEEAKFLTPSLPFRIQMARTASEDLLC